MASRGKGRLARWTRMAIAIGLSGAAFAALPVTDAAARYATGGTGLYKGSIDWFEWGTSGSSIPNAGTTVSNTRLIGSQSLVTTCTIGAFTGNLNVVTPGGFGGSAFDDLYNIGGAGGANQLASGLAVSAQTVTFPLSCSAELDGTPVPLGGLVMADAEQSATNEYIEATIPADATWRILDRFRSAGCTQTTNATLDAGGTLRLANTGLCGVGPMAVAYMDGTTSATVSLRGGGTSIISLGVVLNTDFGDAPASYGSKGALLAAPVLGGEVPVGTTPVSGDDFALATLGTTTPRLGATVTAEGEPAYSALADGDDGDDSVSLTTTGPIGPGQVFTIPSVACTGTGSVAGWLDWDGDGTFTGPGEASIVSDCTGGTASLSWTAPAVITPAPAEAPTFVRIAFGPDAASVASPTGLMLSGEVEDHAITIPPNVPPTVVVSGPGEGAVYFVGQSVPAAYGCSDVDGTVVSCDGPVPVGSNVDTSTPGSKSFSVTATDDEGATGSSTVSYVVRPVGDFCRGLAAGALGIPLLGVANQPQVPCKTAASALLNHTVPLTPNPPLPLLGLPLLGANNLKVTAATSTTTSGPGSAAATSEVAAVEINLPLLGISLKATGLSSAASSTLTSCGAPATTVASGTITTLVINGKTYPVGPNQYPVNLGVGTLYINWTHLNGNGVDRASIFLDLPGDLLDVYVAHSRAGAICP